MSKTISMKSTLFSQIMIALLFGFIPVISFAGSWNGWIYQDPYPTSNTLFAVKFVTPLKGWVAGEGGTILYTEDGGDTWEAQESGTAQALTNITFVNENKGWAVVSDGVILHTENGGKTWIPQTETGTPLRSVFFLNEMEGWTAGTERLADGVRGVVFHTIDGGKSWDRLNTDIHHATVSVKFIGSQIGWVLAGDEVYRTQDGGKTWEESKLSVKLPSFGYPNTSYDVQPPFRPSGGPDMFQVWDRGEITFVDDKNGWAVVGFGSIMHTRDGGKTWENQNLAGALAYGLNHISFSDSRTGCAVGSSILCTEDGGQTWKERLGVAAGSSEVIDHFLIDLLDISFAGRSTGWAVGMEGQVLKTEDTGKTWKMVARRDKCGDKIFFVNKKIGFFFGGNPSYICRTDDSGLTRQKQEVGFVVLDAFFMDNETGWVVGLLQEGKNPENPDKIYGIIKRTSDGGKTWSTQFKELMGKKNTEDGLYKVFFVNRKSGWATGYKGAILHTDDGGKNWFYQKKDTPDLYLGNMWFINSKVGWIIGTIVNLTGTTVGDEWIVFWLSVNWTFSPFEINYLERRKVHAKEATQLHARREGRHTQASPGRTGPCIGSV